MLFIMLLKGFKQQKPVYFLVTYKCWGIIRLYGALEELQSLLSMIVVVYDLHQAEF